MIVVKLLGNLLLIYSSLRKYLQYISFWKSNVFQHQVTYTLNVSAIKI